MRTSFLSLGFAVFLALNPTRAAAVDVDVELEGLEGPLETNVKAVTSIVHAEDDLTPQKLRRLHKRAPEEIALALEPFGYYAPRIESSLEETGDTWHARYVVDAGPPVLVHRVDVQVTGEGAGDAGFRDAVEKFPLVANAPLDHAAYDVGKGVFLLVAGQKGYFDARFDSSAILVDRHAYRSEVVLHFDTGPRYEFGPVNLRQDVLDPRLLEGHISFHPGDPYDLGQVLALQTALSSGPYFRLVEARPRRDLAQGRQVPIEVELSPASTQEYEISVGYGTDTQFRGKLGVELRRVNRQGHHADAELVLSAVEMTASAQYFIPTPYPRTEVFGLNAGLGRFSPEWSTSIRGVLGANVSRSRGSWREVFSLAYEHEDYEIAEVDGASSLVIPGASWTRTRADDRLYPTRGSRLLVELKGSHDAVLSSATFLQLHLTAKVIRSLASRVRVIARAEAGSTYTPHFDRLPPTVRFVTGGDQTVRGFGYQSLGPRNAAGDIVGGDVLAIGSFEVEYRLLSSWGVAAFFDAGNAMNSFTDVYENGAGAGIRWRSPVGQIRLDGAYGLTAIGRPFRIHFSIGPDF